MRDLALTVFIFALVPQCFLKPWVGVIVWYWFGLMNPHRHTWDFAYSMPFAIWIGGATLAGALFARDRRPVPWNRELVLVAILLAYFTVTTLFAWSPEHAWAQWEKVFKIIFMTFVATMFIYGKDRVRILMLTIALSIGFYGVKGALWVLRSGGGERVQGPEGSFIDGNTFIGLAFNMVLGLLIVLAREEQAPWFKRVLYGSAWLTVISTIFTYSRGAYLGLIAILPLIFLRARNKALAAGILIPAAVLAPMVLPEQVFRRADQIENYETEGSANQRLQSWTVAWNLAKDYPFTGAGFEFEYAGDEARWLQYGSDRYTWALSHSSSAHSIYFQVLGQHGFVALVLFIALLGGTLLSLQRTKSRAAARSDTQWIANYGSGIQVGLVGYMVSGAFLSSAYFDLAYVFIALSAVLARELTSAETPTTSVAVAADEGATIPPRPLAINPRSLRPIRVPRGVTPSPAPG